MPSQYPQPNGRPPLSRQHTPLLETKGQNYASSDNGSPNGYDRTPRSARFKERNPEVAVKDATRKRYIYASFFLVLSLISFCIQTETAVYIQANLGWNKAYAMLYFTHGSWSVLWFMQLLILRLQKWNVPFRTFLSDHIAQIRETALIVKHQSLHAHRTHSEESPWPYIARSIATLTCALTIAGGSWYVAVDLTTASDLTAIYNCNAFFAYAFSVPLLGERLRWDKVTAVAIAVVGVFVVAYGDSFSSDTSTSSDSSTDTSSDLPPSRPDSAPSRGLGNLIIGVGSILYGLYEVLYKRLGCPPSGTSPGRSMIFANFIGTCIGLFTLTFLWIPLPLLNYTGLEVWELPRGDALHLLLISVFANAVFSGCFLVLMSLTSPVLASVAALLTIFLVAIIDEVMPPPLHNDLSTAALFGGTVIIVAFLMLSWATYREMDEERREKAQRDELEDSEGEEQDEV